MSEKRLLVVDDEPEFGELVRKVAAGLGYEARVATSGREFQEALLELPGYKFCLKTECCRS